MKEVLFTVPIEEYPSIQFIDEIILSEVYKAKLKAVMRSLIYNEKELISYIYFGEYSLKKYAEGKVINCSDVYSKNVGIINKLKGSMGIKCRGTYLN